MASLLTIRPEATVRLDRIVYTHGMVISAVVKLSSGVLSNEDLRLFVVAPASKDAEIIPLIPSGQGVYITDNRITIEATSKTASVEPNDGKLTLKPNERFVAMLIIHAEGNEKDHKSIKAKVLAADFGLLEDKDSQVPKVEVLPKIAMTDDEINIPKGGKRIGTIAIKNGLPVQIPVDELIIYPTDEKQLEEFLKLTEGEIIMDNSIANKGENNKVPTSYLVKVNVSNADVEHLTQIRALFGEKETLLASSQDVLQIYSLAMQCWLKGFIVGVNPRLQYMSDPGIPRTHDGLEPTSTPDFNAMSPDVNESAKIFADPDGLLKIRQAWAFLALWDKNIRNDQINVGFLDMGFAPNWDFRGFPNAITERDLENGTTGPHSAEAPPTVGAGFFGPPVWHGNGVVTTAAGVLNNGWGAVGTGGQVVVPMLYKTGLRSYAFEMGNGMIQATRDGAAIINISAGYPCRVISNVHLEFEICRAEERLRLCAALRALLQPAIDLLLLVPFVGPFLNAEAEISADTAFGFCLAVLVVEGGDVRGRMTEGVEFAKNRGVPVVSVAGNQIPREAGITVGPINLCDLISCGEQDVGDWQMIPGVIPGVICVGAADPNANYKNMEFFGNRVDIWAPVNSVFFHPREITRIGTVEEQVRENDFNGTSAAAPYITGIIAMMMAINPTLNPTHPTTRTRTTAQLAMIPTLIRNLLVNNATPGTMLPNLPPAGSPPDPANFQRRRNLVNAFKSVKAAAMGIIPDFDSLGYDTTLGLTDPGNGNSQHPMIIPALVGLHEISRTILTIPTGPGLHVEPDLTYSSTHWYQWVTPAQPGIYGEGRIILTLPISERFGSISVRAGCRPSAADHTRIECRNEWHWLGTPIVRNELEEVREYSIPSTFGDQSFLIEVTGTGSISPSDNVYKIRFLPGRRIGDNPQPDRFDRPAHQHNNDTWGRAIPLGVGEFIWQNMTPDTALPGIRVSEILIPDLNFDRANDEDWFLLHPPEDVPMRVCPACPPYINIVTENASCIINVYRSDDNVHPLITGVGSVRVRCNLYLDHFPVRIQVLYNRDQPTLDYNLRVRYISDIPEMICREAEIIEVESDEIIDLRCLPCGMKFYDPTDDLYEKVEADMIDSAGRITKPQFYSIHLKAKKSFNIECVIDKGVSLGLQFLSPKGEIIAKTATVDLLGLPQFKDANKPVERLDSSVLYLSIPELSEGVYFVSVSHGLANTAFKLRLLQD